MNDHLFYPDDLNLPDGAPVTSWSPRRFDGVDDMIAFNAMLRPPLPQVAYHPSSRTARLLRSAQASIQRWQRDRRRSALMQADPDRAPRYVRSDRFTTPDNS